MWEQTGVARRVIEHVRLVEEAGAEAGVGGIGRMSDEDVSASLGTCRGRGVCGELCPHVTHTPSYLGGCWGAPESVYMWWALRGTKYSELECDVAVKQDELSSPEYAARRKLCST